MGYCLAEGCKNDHRIVKMRRVPRDRNYAVRWLLRLGREEVIDVPGDRRVCSAHFEAEAFNPWGRLKKDAIPTLLLSKRFRPELDAKYIKKDDEDDSKEASFAKECFVDVNYQFLVEVYWTPKPKGLEEPPLGPSGPRTKQKKTGKEIAKRGSVWASFKIFEMADMSNEVTENFTASEDKLKLRVSFWENEDSPVEWKLQKLKMDGFKIPRPLTYKQKLEIETYENFKSDRNILALVRSTVLLEHDYCKRNEFFDAHRYHESMLHHVLSPGEDLREPMEPDLLPQYGDEWTQKEDEEEQEEEEIEQPEPKKVKLFVRPFGSLALTEFPVQSESAEWQNCELLPVICCDEQGNLYQKENDIETEDVDETLTENEFYDLSVRSKDFNLGEVDFITEETESQDE